jgi:hypothetical protein
LTEKTGPRVSNFIANDASKNKGERTRRTVAEAAMSNARFTTSCR